MAAGLKHYLGRPCKNCGGRVRKVRDWNCYACSIAKLQAWRAANPDRALESRRRWGKQNRKKIREQRREQYRQDPRSFLDRTKKWREANPEKAAAIRKRRRLRDNRLALSVSEVVFLAARQGGKCASCKRKLLDGVEIDHIRPLALGGNGDVKNLQLLCPICNRRKHARDPSAIATEEGRLV